MTTPVRFKSTEGCVTCSRKSSTSRFTLSQKYPDLSQCFQMWNGQDGEVCNPCVLKLKRWRRNPYAAVRKKPCVSISPEVRNENLTTAITKSQLNSRLRRLRKVLHGHKLEAKRKEKLLNSNFFRRRGVHTRKQRSSEVDMMADSGAESGGELAQSRPNESSHLSDFGDQTKYTQSCQVKGRRSRQKAPVKKFSGGLTADDVIWCNYGPKSHRKIGRSGSLSSSCSPFSLSSTNDETTDDFRDRSYSFPDSGIFCASDGLLEKRKRAVTLFEEQMECSTSNIQDPTPANG